MTGTDVAAACASAARTSGWSSSTSVNSASQALRPADPQWVNRDRFVLSSGHGCMIQDSALHLAGYDNVSMDDLKQFRQWGSETPGHPENFETAGIEVTTATTRYT